MGIVTASDQSPIFTMIDPWLHDLKDGERVLVLAYGASNSGKTYTIQGTPEDRGLIFPIISKYLNQNDAKIQISFLEIYQETMKDLVTGDQVTLSCFENGSYKGLS